MSFMRSGVKLVDEFWAWCWSYLSGKMRVGEAAASYEMDSYSAGARLVP